MLNAKDNLLFRSDFKTKPRIDKWVWFRSSESHARVQILLTQSDDDKKCVNNQSHPTSCVIAKILSKNLTENFLVTYGGSSRPKKSLSGLWELCM